MDVDNILMDHALVTSKPQAWGVKSSQFIYPPICATVLSTPLFYLMIYVY